MRFGSTPQLRISCGYRLSMRPIITQCVHRESMSHMIGVWQACCEHDNPQQNQCRNSSKQRVRLLDSRWCRFSECSLHKQSCDVLLKYLQFIQGMDVHRITCALLVDMYKRVCPTQGIIQYARRCRGARAVESRWRYVFTLSCVGRMNWMGCLRVFVSDWCVQTYRLSNSVFT